MASANALKGLMKWLDRAEWQEPFEELIWRHLGAACEQAGIAPDELADAFGGHHASVLWGCMVEDFMAYDLDDGSNIVDDYLRRRGWKESVPAKRYLAALRSSVMSLYEVSDVVRGQSFLARDLLRGGEPVRVSEKSATQALKQWDRLAARIVTVGPKSEMAGGALPFSHELSEDVCEGFASLRREMPSEVRDLIRQRHGDTEGDPFAFDTEILRHSAFLFTNAWLHDALQRLIDPQLPRLSNSDGDEIVFTTVRYPLNGTIARKALEGALTAVPGFHRADADLWTWNAPAARASGSVSMGHVALDAEALTLETNSPQRAQKGQALLDPIIGPFVGQPVVASKTAAEIIASPPTDEGRAPSSGVKPDEERAIVHEMLERHYRGLLDEPVPMLGNVSPREAAKTKMGRKKLVDWLKLLENSTARQKADSAMASYDMSWMWEELGLADLRR